MKILYFDCSSGISGNMVLGALTEIVGDESFLIDELEKLHIDGYRIEMTKSMKNGITGTHVNVIVDGTDEYGHVHHIHDHHHHDHSHHDHPQHEHSDHDHSHQGHSHHQHRNLSDINTIIDDSSLNDDTKDLAKRIFNRVAQAESKVHGKALDEVHFHEVGAVDSIVDIVGTAILINRIRPDRILAGVVNEGHGFIHCAHGTMSVPVPATSEIFAAAGTIYRQIDIDTELVTPTGAAIIAELAEDYIPMPAMTVRKIGWGAGTKDLKIPNLLKVSMGETAEEEEDFIVMETNIDDCSGEILGYTMEQLLNQGALDVFYTPVFMKKNRPAYRLTVTCVRADMEKLQSLIFRETTTIGIRYRHEKRARLNREEVTISTAYGEIKGKKVNVDGKTIIYPEYESLKRIAESSGISLKELYKMQMK